MFRKDGFLCTGDVGIWRPDGSLEIVDRVKNLVKLKGGEYISIETMEAEYGQCSLVNHVNGGLMIYGDNFMYNYTFCP